ncbi:MAG: GNAT family N-acetyltransferase [Bacteroidia bacterium]|nr:GNAT family N-acetyltransferase [Bacteroidia bacterium]
MISDDYKYLDWDSDFFKLKIARILPDVLSESQLKDIINRLICEKFVLAYWFANSQYPDNILAAKVMNGFLYDKKTTYGLSLNRQDNFLLDKTIEIYTKSEIAPQLINLALESGKYSRFKTDNHFPKGSFERLYTEWIYKSMQKELADIVFVHKTNDIINGMITLYVRNYTGYIGLVGVDYTFHRQNIGNKLMAAAKNYFIQKNCVKIEVVTQGDNIPACKYYEKNGFKKIKTEYLFHFWI